MSETKNERQPWQHTLTDGLLSVAGIICLVCGVVATMMGNAVRSPVFLGAGLVLMFAGTFDRFESFKGLGIDVKARILDHKIEQADDALQRLRELAELSCEAVMTLSAYAGRWNHHQTQSSGYTLATRVTAMLSGLGSDTQTIRHALKPYAEIACWDAASPLVTQLKQLLDNRLNNLNGWLGFAVNGPNAQDPAVAVGVADMDAERTKVIAFITHFNNSLPIPLASFPDTFLQLFDDAPLEATAELDVLRRKALSLKEGMQSLSSTSTVGDPDSWFKAVAAAEAELPAA